MSLFKRAGSPHWYCEFVVKGTRFRRSTGTASRREAAQFERDLKASVALRLERFDHASPSLTIDQACGRYWIEHGHRLRSADDVQRQLLYITTHTDKTMALAELGPAAVTACVHAMRDAGVGDISINRTIETFRAVHNRAGKMWEQPIKVIDWKPYKVKERARVRWISQDQARAMLAALPEPTRDLVLFMLLTGIRRREAFKLEWRRVHLDRGTITITAKGGVVREVDLAPDAIALLHEIRRPSGPVFDATGWRKRFGKAKQAAGIDDFRWHDLRHTFATWLGQSGASLEVIKEALGHSTIAMTQKYRHVARREVRDALTKVPSITPPSATVVHFKKATK